MAMMMNKEVVVFVVTVSLLQAQIHVDEQDWGPQICLEAHQDVAMNQRTSLVLGLHICIETHQDVTGNQ